MNGLRRSRNRTYTIALHILSEIELQRELEAVTKHMQELQGHRDLLKREITKRSRLLRRTVAQTGEMP